MPVRFARVHTPKLHLNVVVELPGIPGVLHICEGDRSSSPVYFAFVKRTGRRTIPGRAKASLSAAMNFEHGDGDEDYLPNGNESFAANHRHLQELQRLSAFQLVTTKVPPSYDGRSSWFAYEDAIDDWSDITKPDGDKRGPALRNRLEGEAATHKRLLDRDRLKDPNNGVKYFKSFLRPLFVKGAADVFLYCFQQFMNLHRGNGDMLRWITRFQRMQEAWNDTYLPITDPMNAEVRAFIAGLPAEEQGTITNDEAMERANERLRDQHARTTPITANLVALIFVSPSDLTQDQRQVLTSLMAHRNRLLADYRLNELREVYLEIFCSTKTSVDNPLLAPSGHGGRKTFLVIEEGYLDNQEGYWVEDEEDGAERFLEADEDSFWVYDEENYSWFQRRFQRRKMKRGFKGQRKGKGKARRDPEEGASSRRGKAGRTLLTTTPKPGKQKDSDTMNPGKSHLGMTGPGTMPWNPMQPRAKVRKERRAKAKASMAKMEKMEKVTPKMDQPILLIVPKAAPRSPPQQLSTPNT